MFRRLFTTLFALACTLTLVPSAHANSFPSCESYLGKPGDIAHYTSGMHQIVGGSLLSGSDDVYTLANNNFLQCFCPVDGNTGVQTNWLRSDHEISGWLFVNGSDWNLGNYSYAAQNTGFNCKPTPTNTHVVVSDSGHSDPGLSQASAPVCDSQKPLPPGSLSVIRTKNTAKLTWKESADATHYSIVYGTKPGQYEYGVANTGKTNMFTVGSLDPNQKYFFAVNAVNNCMPSDKTTSGEVLGSSTVKGLAGTGMVSQITLLFAVGLISLILFIGLNKLISSCENNENIKTLINTTKKCSSIIITHIHDKLRFRSLLSLGPVFKPLPAQFFFTTSHGPPGRDRDVGWYRSGSLAYSIA